MQEPVFRTSEGEKVVPRAKEAAAAVPPSPEAAALESLYAPPEAVEPEASAEEFSPSPAPETVAAAAPALKEAGGEIIDQPYVSEEYDVAEINAAVAAASPKGRSKSSLIFKLLAAAIVLGALAIATVFVVWFLWMRPGE